MEGDVILAGDFNQVWDVFIDQSRFTGPPITKDRAAINMLSEDNGLVDIWCLINPSEGEHTFFSKCHTTYSRIYTFLISNNVTNKLHSVK